MVKWGVPEMILQNSVQTHCRGPKSLNFPDGNFQRAKAFRAECVNRFRDKWLAIAKLKPLSLFISVLLMLKKALDNVKMEK